MGFCPPEAYGLLGKHDIYTKKDLDYKSCTRIKKRLTQRIENSLLLSWAGWTKASEFGIWHLYQRWESRFIHLKIFLIK